MGKGRGDMGENTHIYRGSEQLSAVHIEGRYVFGKSIELPSRAAASLLQRSNPTRSAAGNVL
jgi:hypothetical protein